MRVSCEPASQSSPHPSILAPTSRTFISGACVRFLPLEHPAAAAAFALVGVGALCILLVALGLIARRGTATVKAAQLNLSLVIVFAALAYVLSLVSYVGENETGRCLANVWTVNLTFTVTFAALFQKIYKVRARAAPALALWRRARRP